jgi:uncharacterized protein
VLRRIGERFRSQRLYVLPSRRSNPTTFNNIARIATKLKTLLIPIPIIIIANICLYGFFVEPVEVRPVSIHDCALAKVLKDKVVVQISDLHIKRIGRREEKVLERVYELKPDIIFLTGDYVKWKGDYEVALTFLSKLEAKIGVWAVMGDYDYSNSRKSCLFCHELNTGKPTKRHQVKFLRDETEEVDVDGKAIWIGGLEFEGDNATAARETLSHWKGREPAIILCHDPLRFDQVDQKEDVLVLAGDTHGGQIPLPCGMRDVLQF